MKSLNYFGIIFIFSLIAGCSKDDGLPPANITGEWAFTNQFSQSFAFPSVLKNPFPVSTSSWMVSNDSTKIMFDTHGNYSFYNFRMPVESGSYKIVQDSILVIKPTTSGFLRFCYTTPQFYASATTNPPIIPSNYHFTSDTIYFKKSGNNIVFTAYWLNMTPTPIQPSMDTLMLTVASSNFKKL